MQYKYLNKHILLIISLIFFVSAHSNTIIETPLLKADFNDELPGSSLDEGGAANGEPIDFDFLDNKIIEDVPGENFLQISNSTSLTNAMYVTWELIDNREINQGIVTFSFDFTPAALDNYSFAIHEAGGSSKLFLVINFLTDGTYSLADEAGPIPLGTNTYDAAVTLDLAITFDMNAGTSQLAVNGVEIFSGREHGIGDRGVGRLITGYADSNQNTPFDLDNISVIQTTPLLTILAVNFEDKMLGSSLDIGGAEINRPVEISTNLFNEIIAFESENQALLLENPVTGANIIRWQFLENHEATQGMISIEADIYFNQIDNYQLAIREASGSASSFSTVRFFNDSSIIIYDSAGNTGIVGTYQTDQRYRLKAVFNLDADSYGVWLDDDVLVDNRLHGVMTGDGIGAFTTGFQSTSSTDASFVIDNLAVGVSVNPFVIFGNGFEPFNDTR